ncbi:MAG: hypothetical protein RSF81_08060 [Oscillospiraceae bacterium]
MLFNCIILLGAIGILIAISVFKRSKKNKIICRNIHKYEEKASKNEKRVNTILYNIDVYNGTESGQREVI